MGIAADFMPLKGRMEIPMTLEEILNVSVTVGYRLLTSGAEVSRVEQSMQYICRAYGITDMHIFAIPSSIVVTISDGTASLTTSRRVRRIQTNLDHVVQYNALSRYICSCKPDYEEIQEKIHEIEKRKPWSYFLRLISHMGVAMSFCIFFGGTLADGIVAAFVGAIIMLCSSFLNNVEANTFFTNIVCSFMAAFISRLVSSISVFSLHSDKIIIGSIMLLVPGLSLANAMRDFISSDTMTGISRVTEAILVAAGLAVGVALAMMLY